MQISELPSGSAPAPLANPLFPTSWQNFISRNWGLLPPAKLAAILGTGAGEICAAAADMGLPPAPGKFPDWTGKGYLTLIRNNWHLLNYEQLLQLLEWTPEKMAYTLKEEDFFWHKLGLLKPLCPELKMTPLTQEQKERTAWIKAQTEKLLPEEKSGYVEEPFAFADLYGARDGVKGDSLFDFSFIHSYAASCGDVLEGAIWYRA